MGPNYFLCLKRGRDVLDRTSRRTYAGVLPEVRLEEIGYLTAEQIVDICVWRRID